MKRLIALCGLAPLLALAGPREDYVQAWTLVPGTADAGAYRVTLDEAVYRSVQRSDLGDLDVINADGASVPAALVASPTAAGAARTVELRWFPLPASAGDAQDDLSVISTRSDDGRVLRVEARGTATPARGPAWLVDASQLREPVEAVELHWDDGGVEAGYRVEGSDDLRDWRLLHADAPMLDLQRDGQRLRQGRIPVGGAHRYLRLTPVRGTMAPALTGVAAVLAPRSQPRAWSWIALEGRAVTEQGRTVFDYVLPGRFPVASVDLQVVGNSAARWTLRSRDGDDGTWQLRAGPWVAFNVRGDGREDRSPPQALAGPVRDRQWRLHSEGPAGEAAPVLRLGYQPETLVFLAQGPGPFALAAGSARATRADAPVSDLLGALRRQHGDDWQPAPATLAATPTVLAGEAALQPPDTPRDWTQWLLWAVLLAGVGLVVAFAMQLLRRPRAG
ncbi:DUF3999 domain-containing protein [Luteimonas sp. BDR2-5]|uniref:DUF3999 domain-containing protein n=1 Tax=Proluteimonas luteida TaxID=2878685 RepID=UPI001E4187C6|nr:DUF3999 domain-containing protein [Luteimonas sp. BDR2-5]MCD9028857.1 DUF3999 domain-containing protein [Luteimonas sp. BDR2-5]